MSELEQPKKSAFNIPSEKVPGLTKLAALCWVIVTILLLLVSLASLLSFWSVNYLREGLIIVVLFMAFWLWQRTRALIAFRHASIGHALGLDTDRLFMKKFKKLEDKIKKETNQQKINKLVEKKIWIESYLSDEAKEELKKTKKDGE